MRTIIKILLCFILCNISLHALGAGEDVSIKAQRANFIISTDNPDGYLIKGDNDTPIWLSKSSPKSLPKSKYSTITLLDGKSQKKLRTLVQNHHIVGSAAASESRVESPTKNEAATALPAIESRSSQKENNQEKHSEAKTADKRTTERMKAEKPSTSNTPVAHSTIGVQELRDAFNTYLQDHPFYNDSVTATREEEVRNHIRELDKLDNEQKRLYADENEIQHFLKQSERSLMRTKEATDEVLDDFFDTYEGQDIANRDAVVDEFRDILKKRQRDWDIQLDELADAARLEYKRQTETMGWLTIAIMLGILLLLGLCGWMIYRRSKTPNRPMVSDRPTISGVQTTSTASGGGNENIVVRRRTTSILKKQSIDDVVNNEHYLCIECADFCADSTVRRIYIKNTCVKDIYNMYAEDLRNPSNPKEDGCMVLGRWVLDGQSDQYDVSLEQIVKPGDDAIFSEYELNFGGKIKLRVAERLRKLRRETNLQYDLTCWVHSHPGLGVFFSNSDNNVQMQLKHPTQPYFLTAFVIDILTPEQTLGIFTFRRDGTVNSQTDLTRMYSLEEMYQWAIASERSAFNPNDYYNALTGCRVRHNQCRGIELGNGAIIDMAQLSSQPESGLIGYAHGFIRTQDNLAEYVTDGIGRERTSDGKDTVGCFVVATHFSLPSVRRAVADELDNIHFVLVYSTSDDLLTAIPVLNGVLCGDENYYGENKLEDLKIWTRRKR